jgi:acyl-CoA hydrolase
MMPKQSAPQAKPVRASQSEVTEVVFPNDANPGGSMLGGRVMHLMDMAAGIAAHRHSNSRVVTASVDHMDFRVPIQIGDLIVLKASVNRVFNSSMEVGVKVFREESITNRREHTSSAYLTMVATDTHGRPKRAPVVLPETADEKRRYLEAGVRRKQRIEQRGRKARKRPQ